MNSIYVFASDVLYYVVPFLIVLSIVVFVHEFGHFVVARRCRVKVETFSIGFGPEIFGWFDKTGTRWRVAWLPFGGYVKMFGDSDPTSALPDEEVRNFTEAEKKIAFYSQSVLKRFAIVFAGPAMNYVFAVLVLAGLFLAVGQPYTPPVVEQVMDKSVAQAAGIKSGDKVVSIDGKAMNSFEDIKRVIALNVGAPVDIRIERGGRPQVIRLMPEVVRTIDRLGGEHVMGKLGLLSSEQAFRELPPFEALQQAVFEAWDLSASTLKGLGQMILGSRGADELGGPLRIAEMSGKVAKEGFAAFIWFVAVLSVNLGLINLFPIPLLDGGHLVFYLAEGLRGRPVSERTQEYGARTGLVIVIALMLFATWNDLVHLRVISFLSTHLRSLFT
jgi:regulator of sigma E protease